MGPIAAVDFCAIWLSSRDFRLARADYAVREDFGALNRMSENDALVQVDVVRCRLRTRNGGFVTHTYLR